MLAFHGKQAIKDKYLARVRAHRAADELIQGTGWYNGRGCAVGCTLEAYDHSRYPIELGIPLDVAHLEDALFELLQAAEAQAWPERFLVAIRPGTDLSYVWRDWAYWMLLDPHHGVLRFADGEPDVAAAIRQVAALYAPGTVAAASARAEASAEAAEASVWARAERAARAARAAAAAARAGAEAASAAAEAASAAAEAEWPDAWAAQKKWITGSCNKLISLLEACR